MTMKKSNESNCKCNEIHAGLYVDGNSIIMIMTKNKKVIY